VPKQPKQQLPKQQPPPWMNPSCRRP
jgi:hypothetical protein